MERIEILRGPAAVQYGSAAMGGIVNVITKRGEGKPSGSVQGTYGSDGFREGVATLAGAAKGLDFSGSYSRSASDDYDTAEAGPFPNTAVHMQDSQSINLGYTFLEEHRIGVTYHRNRVNHAGSPEYLIRNDLDDYADKSNRSADIVYDGQTRGGAVSWMARYFEGRDMDKWVDPVESNPDLWDDGVDSERETHQRGVQAQVTLNGDVGLVTAGFDWVDYEIQTTWNPRITAYENPSGFLLGKLRLLDERLVLSGGLRYDTYEVSVVDPAGRTEDDDRLTPRVGATFLLTDAVTLRANYAEAFVMPGADQLASDYVAFGRRQLGNPDLKPEKSRTWEVGAGYAGGGVDASLTWFYTDYEDKIEDVTTAAGDSSWENLGEAVIQGFEGALSCDVGVWMDWEVEVRPYVRAVYLVEYEDETTGADLQYTSDLELSAGISVTRPEDYTVSLNLAFTGAQWVDDWESGINPTPVVEKGSFAVVNLFGRKRLPWLDRFGDVYAHGSVENLLDRSYAYVKGYPMPGIQFFGGLEWRF